MHEQEQQELETIKREIERRRQEHQAGTSTKRIRRRWFRSFLALAAGIFLALGGIFLFNFFRLNADLIDGQIKKRLIPQIVGASVSVFIGRVSGDLLSGVELENVMLRNPRFRSGGVLLAIGRVSLKYSLLDVFLGRAVVERLFITDPVLTLTRGEDGRPVWDFRDNPGEPVSPAVPTPATSLAGPEQLVERFMKHVEIRNLSVLVPRPRDFFPDKTIAKILHLPPGNISWGGLNLLMRKYSSPTFVDHVLLIWSGNDAPMAKLQVNHLRANGDVTYSLSVKKHAMVAHVKDFHSNRPQFFISDERNRDRLNLRFFWNREGLDWENRISGLSGNLNFENLRDLKEILPQVVDLGGRVSVSFLASDSDQLRDTTMLATIEDASVLIPGGAELENGYLDFVFQERRGKISRLDFSWMGLAFSQTGELDFRTRNAVMASFSAKLVNEPLSWQAELRRLDDDERSVSIQVERPAGKLHLRTTQFVESNHNIYRDTRFTLKVGQGKKVTDLLPAKLIPPSFSKIWASMTAMLELLGPLEITGSLPGKEGVGNSECTIDLDGATVQDPVQQDNRIELHGRLKLASSTMELRKVGFRLKNLELNASGVLHLDAANRRFQGGEVEVIGSLSKGDEWELDGKNLQRLLARAEPIGFDRIVLQGDRILHLRFGTDLPEQKVLLTARKAVIVSGRQVLRLEPFVCEIGSTEKFNPEKLLPNRVFLDAKAGIFGIHCVVSSGIDLTQWVFQSLNLSMDGKNLSSLMSALSEIPAVREFRDRHNLTLEGAFKAAFSGNGPFLWPTLKGEINFPQLNIKVPGLSATLPFSLNLETLEQGRYQGIMQTSEAKLNLRGVTFKLDRLRADWKLGRSRISTDHLLSLKINSSIFETEIQGELDVLPKMGIISLAALSIRGRNLETLSQQVARVGKFNIPFTMIGKLNGDWVASGTFRNLTSRASFELEGLDLRLPMKSVGTGLGFLDLKKICGRLKLAQKGFDRFDVAIEDGSANCLDAPISLNGTAHLEKGKGNAWITVLDQLTASFENLKAETLFRLLSSGTMQLSRMPRLSEVTGVVSGSVQISGQQNRYFGLGKVNVENVGFFYPGLSRPVNNLGGTITLARRRTQKELVLEVDKVTAGFGRARLSVPRGVLIDPFGICKIDFSGSLEDVYPTDVLAMLSGLKVPSLRFPKEGKYSGKASVSGPFNRPILNVQAGGSEETHLIYSSEGQEYQLPIGRTSLSFSFEPENGMVSFDPSEVSLLDGKIVVLRAEGQIRNGRPTWFNSSGTFEGVRLGTFSKDGEALVRGTLAGSFQAEQKQDRSRELMVRLGLQDLKIMALPVNPEIIERIGLEFLEEPEFATGSLNLYLSTDGDVEERGRLRIADGLVAGPDLRLEISDSAFNPRDLQVDGKLMINPQPLRRTKIGRKLGKLTKCLQDKATGIPYIDLKVQGSWDKPNLVGKIIVNRLKKRGKRNFIRSIFGGHRPHKASVQELREWFPGWEP